jgi:hypothetical protein
MAMHLNDRMFETHLSTPISQTFALIAGDCNTTDCRSHRLSCEELIGADETNPSRGPSPPESKKNGRAVLYCTHMQQKWVAGL